MTLYEALGLKDVPERILLIDGHSALFRCFYAIPDLATSKGEPVNALYGFVRTLLMALREYPSRYVAVAFDTEGKTVRHATFAAYKATRKPMPEALSRQLPRVKPLLSAFGVPHVECPGYEADDVMATLARRAAAEGIPALLLTGDKDMAQVVSDKIFLLRPGRKPSDRLTLVDRAGVEALFGVKPEQIVDLLALEGDSIDNVPGVPGVGEKTAVELLRQFGNLEGVLQAAPRLGNRRVAQALQEHRDAALLSRELVRLREAPLPLGPRDCALRPIDPQELRALLEELEFKSILAELKLEAEKARAPTYEAVLTEEAFLDLVEKLKRAEEFALDLETTSEDPLSAEIVGIAVALEPYRGYYIPVGHSYRGAPKQLPLEYVLSYLAPLLSAERPRKIGQNLKYDLQVLLNYGIEVRGVAFDAMLAHWLLKPDAPSHSLEAIAREELGIQVQTYKELLALGGAREMREVAVERAARYSGEDAEVVVRLRAPLTQKLREAELLRLFEDLEIPLIEVLLWMERRGVLLDADELRAQGKELEILLERTREELFALAGGPFNPNSTPQVREILYERLKLPVLERTKTGPSTDAQVLRDLAQYHEFPAKLIAYRELEKLRNTYVEKLPHYVHPRTGRIHTSFNQTGTATGRLSSSEPNLQNIPTKTEVGVDIRRAFVAPPGKVLLGADYSQIELRILAHMSGDEALLEAFQRGEDLHRRTAAVLFGVPPEAVDSRMRTIAKRVNFGIIYGITPYGLSRDVGIPQEEAKALIDRFFQAYPKVAEFLEKLVEEAQATGFARTLLGRKRPLPGLRNPERRGIGQDRRNAINTPIQGTAADLMKLAMLRIHRAWKEGRLPAEMILQIHDELVFEVAEGEAERAGALIRDLMEGVWELRAPLKVDVKIGRNWSEI
ncbi:MAG: DNA polymerase I [Candidatus Bipolaricaulota bacterium]|nr:DNA polymerase I [Candidatus Bipolaricaulota bacterium]MDW8151855.1 DNA polymerase I [Candidatus Bipolaricaulota bacterium]